VENHSFFLFSMQDEMAEAGGVYQPPSNKQLSTQGKYVSASFRVFPFGNKFLCFLKAEKSCKNNVFYDLIKLKFNSAEQRPP
jgi:hypothetical protein